MVAETTSDRIAEGEIQRLEMSLDRKNFTFDALFRLIEKLGTTLELDKIIRLFLMTLVGQLSLGQVSLYLFSPSGKKLKINHSLGLPRDAVLDSMDMEADFVRWLLDQEYPVPIDRYRGAPEETVAGDRAMRDLLLKNQYRFAYPIMNGSDLLALIMFGDKVTGEQFTDFNVEVLHMITSVASMTIKNAMLYRETLQSKMELENFAKLKKEFMHHTSHELRTPLTVLKSSLFSLDPGEGGNAMLINMAREAVARLHDVVEQVLSLNDVELDESFFRFQVTDIAQFLEGYFRGMIPKLGEKGITVKFDRSESKLYMSVDSAKIKIVLDSIIDNAVSSLDRGGAIYLSTLIGRSAPGEGDGIEITTGDLI
ncbi:MAG: hypothetical protein JXB45_10855, partial [Candidatus Krumholzibacteriota bacterium]|nr:hypothetical protein [Candidatus Krumholzibacteriota bacterium]